MIKIKKSSLEKLKFDSEILKDIHRVNCLQSKDTHFMMQEYLKIGEKYLGLEFGIVSTISESEYVVVNALSPSNELEPGLKFELENTYCQKVVKQGRTITHTHVGADPEMCKHPVFEAMALESYIGCPIVVDNEIVGTLNFSSKSIRKERFSESAINLVEILSDSIASQLKIELYTSDLQKKAQQLDLEVEKLKRQKRKQQKLEREKRKVEKISHRLHQILKVGGWELDLNSNQLKWTDEVYNIYGLPLGKIPPLQDAINFYPTHERPRITQCVQDCIEKGKIYHDNFEFIDAKGQKKWVNAYGEPVYDSAGKIRALRGFFQDVTSAILKQQQVERLKNEAEKANRAKSMFLANMSHELRTPLNAIIGYSEIVLEEIEELETPLDQVSEDIKKIQSSGEHLLSLINQLLQLSKVESGKVDLVPTDFQVNELIERVNPICKPIVEENRNQIEFEVQNHSGRLHNDLEKLSQVIINLVANAAKFTKNGKVTVRLYDEKAERTIIEVEDTGVGIKKSHLARIFEEFEQVDQSMKKEYEGTGLGLAISKKFVRLMGGNIEVESEPNVGSLFRINIPSKVVHKNSDKNEAA